MSRRRPKAPLESEPLWVKVAVERKAMRPLQTRTNVHGLTKIALFFGLLTAFGSVTVLSPNRAITIIAFVLYGTVFAFAEAILHETHHRTPFRSLRINEVVHFVVGVMVLKEPTRDRWLHAAHHTYTSYPDADPEVLIEPPPNFTTATLGFLRLRPAVRGLAAMLRNATGSVDPLTRTYVPPSVHRRIVWSSRAILGIYVAVVGASVAYSSWWPVLLFFAARIAGAPYHSLLIFVQHAGLEQNVPDFRDNTRTVLMSRISRFLYWNMNYHLEHHMYPTVPFHALPRLHEQIKDECPAPYRSTWHAWREMLPVLWRQRTEPTVVVRRRRLPDGLPVTPL
jgi:fatty acid desaturase